jgi:glucose-6-phosphate 1-dehydrogenase
MSSSSLEQLETWPAASSCPVWRACRSPRMLLPFASWQPRSTTTTTFHFGSSRGPQSMSSAAGIAADQIEIFADKLQYVRHADGAEALALAVSNAEQQLGEDVRRLHYLSVPPRAAVAVIETLRSAGLVDLSRVIMEKPFGNDLDSAIRLNDQVHESFSESQIFRIDHFLGKEPAQNILAFRFANGLFEPIWNRNFIDHVQIDIPEALGLDTRIEF